MKPYGLKLKYGRGCPWGCCHGPKAANKYINVKHSSSGAQGKKFKRNASAVHRGSARRIDRLLCRELTKAANTRN